MYDDMTLEENSCRFKSVLKLKDKQWDWCFLFNAETSKLDCDKCEYRALYKKPLRIRREIIS